MAATKILVWVTHPSLKFGNDVPRELLPPTEKVAATRKSSNKGVQENGEERAGPPDRADPNVPPPDPIDLTKLSEPKDLADPL